MRSHVAEIKFIFYIIKKGRFYESRFAKSYKDLPLEKQEIK